MTDTTHNGWTNYATWRVNLEMFDGLDWVSEFGDPDPDFTDPYELGLALKDWAEEIISNGEIAPNNLAVDYAMAFLSEVNWQEIALHKIHEADENNFRR